MEPVLTAPPLHQCPDRHLCGKAKAALNVSEMERMAIELQTRNQSGTSTWHAVRAKRVTGSKCGKILKQKHTVALLELVLYGQSFITAPKPIKCGRDNEPVACNAYVEYMKKNMAILICGWKIADCDTSRIRLAWSITRWQGD